MFPLEIESDHMPATLPRGINPEGNPEGDLYALPMKNLPGTGQPREGSKLPQLEAGAQSGCKWGGVFQGVGRKI